MTKRKIYLTAVAGASALTIVFFQNAAYDRVSGSVLDQAAIAKALASYYGQGATVSVPSTGGATTTAAAPAKKALATSAEYVLVGSQTVTYKDSDVVLPVPAIATTQTDRALTTSYAPYLQYRPQDLKEGDLFIAISSVEMTHQPTSPSDTKTTATVSAYLNCNNKVISAIASKSLKRYYGNHHGSMALSGACNYRKASSPNGLSIQLMAKSSLPQGLIHGRQQSVMIVNQYRLLSNVTNPAEVYGALFALHGISPELSITRNIQNSKKIEPFQSTSYKSKASDLVYITAQGTASWNASPVPMYLYALYADGQRLGYTTENVVYNGVPKISQNLMAMFYVRDEKMTNFSTQVNAQRDFDPNDPPSSTGLKFVPGNSQLDALVFRKGLQESSLYLNKVDLSLSSTQVSLVNAKEVQVVAPVLLSFKKSELLHIQALSSISTSSLQSTANCQMQILLTPKVASGSVQKSVASVRSFTSPFNNFTLNAEAFFNVGEGDYNVTSAVLCSGLAGAGASVPVAGSSLMIQAYGAGEK